MVFNPAGKAIGFIRLPERCANLTFGGPKNNRLYMASCHSFTHFMSRRWGGLSPLRHAARFPLRGGDVCARTDGVAAQDWHPRNPHRPSAPSGHFSVGRHAELLVGSCIMKMTIKLPSSLPLGCSLCPRRRDIAQAYPSKPVTVVVPFRPAVALTSVPA